MLWCRKHKANAFCILNSATTDHQRQWLPATLTNSRVMQGGSRWPKSLFVRLAGQNWGGEHCWRHSEDKPRHSPGHAWVTRLAPDLHTVHTPASGPTGSCACTCTRTHTHTRTQHTDTHADCRRVERTGTHHWEIYTAYNWGRLQKEEKNHNKSTQGCMRLNRLECLKVDSKTGVISGEGKCIFEGGLWKWSKYIQSIKCDTYIVSNLFLGIASQLVIIPFSSCHTKKKVAKVTSYRYIVQHFKWRLWDS